MMSKRISRMPNRREALLLGAKLAAGAAALGPMNLLGSTMLLGGTRGLRAQSGRAATRVFAARDYGAAGDRRGRSVWRRSAGVAARRAEVSYRHAGIAQRNRLPSGGRRGAAHQHEPHGLFGGRGADGAGNEGTEDLRNRID